MRPGASTQLYHASLPPCPQRTMTMSGPNLMRACVHARRRHLCNHTVCVRACPQACMRARTSTGALPDSLTPQLIPRQRRAPRMQKQPLSSSVADPSACDPRVLNAWVRAHTPAHNCANTRVYSSVHAATPRMQEQPLPHPTSPGNCAIPRPGVDETHSDETLGMHAYAQRGQRTGG